VLLRYEQADFLGPLFIVIWNSNVRASWVVNCVGCLGCYEGSSPAVAMEQDPELAGRGQQMAQSPAAWCPYHLPPAPRCQLEPDIPNGYDFLNAETKDF
jgi:hypothetical protein